jgi:hypothetical protein
MSTVSTVMAHIEDDTPSVIWAFTSACVVIGELRLFFPDAAAITSLRKALDEAGQLIALHQAEL